MEKPSFLDRKLLYELDLNCRRSNTQIAKSIKTSKDIVNHHIKNLEGMKVIEGYRTIIDMSKLGFFTFRVYLKFQDTDKEIEAGIVETLKKRKEVWWLGKLSGRFDLAFTYWTKSHRKFYEFWIQLLQKYRRYIHHEQVSTFIEYVHYRRAYLINLPQDETKTEIVGGGEEVAYDKTDWKILSLLAKNARAPLLEIAEHVSLTPMAVKYRIKNLEKEGVIQGYRTLIDFSKLGYEYYKVDMYLEDISKLKLLESFCCSHPHIVYIDRTLGASDIEFDLEVKNLTHFIEIIEEIKAKFKGAIRNFEYFSVVKIYKTLYFPE